MAGKKKKDAGIATVLSAAGMLVLLAPALGYFYLEKMKKGAIYLIAGWLVAGVIAAIYLFGSLLTFGLGFICLLPLFFLAFVFHAIIVYDVYLEAKGKKPLLPF